MKNQSKNENNNNKSGKPITAEVNKNQKVAMCISLFIGLIEFLPYICIVTVPFFGSFCGIDTILRLSILIVIFTLLGEAIPKILYSIIPYLRFGLFVLILIYVPVGIIPYPAIWLYDKILWLSDPFLMVNEVVLGLNFVMHCSRQCAEKIQEDEEEAWKWKLLLTLFSATCYAVLTVLVLKIYEDGSNLQFWLVLLVVCFSLMLAAHNMMWMSHEGIVSDVAFVTLCSIVILYMMKEEVNILHSPLNKPTSWHSVKRKSSLLEVITHILNVPLDTAQSAILYLKHFLNPVFMVLLGVRLYSILFFIQRFINNFKLEKEEIYIEDLDTELAPWRSPLTIKLSVIFMVTQTTVKLFNQCTGRNVLPQNLNKIVSYVWPQDLLFGRLLQIVVVNSFYIWRLYCADDWQWSDWFSA